MVVGGWNPQFGKSRISGVVAGERRYKVTCRLPPYYQGGKMAVTTFCAPILPGKTEAWKAAVQEILGTRKTEYDESRRRLGIRREVASLQPTPAGDWVVVYLEADDPDTVLSRILSSDIPFDRWFAATILTGAHGITGPQVPPPNEVFVDWRA